MSQFEIKNGKAEKRLQDDGDDNATLQGDVDGIEFSVACYIDVPEVFLSDVYSIDQAEGIAVDALRVASKKCPLLSFVLTVRPGENVDPDKLVPW